MNRGEPTIERLEGRRLLSADFRSITAHLPQIVPDASATPQLYRDDAYEAIVLVATHGNDDLRIEIDAVELAVYDGDVEIGRVKPGTLDSVQIWGLDGDDQFEVVINGEPSRMGDNHRVWIEGGAGNDTLLGDSGSDTLVGGDGEDELFGHAGGDYLSGGRGEDVLLGDAGDDELWGGAGNDALVAGTGNDTISGGLGREGLDYSQRDETFDFFYKGQSEAKRIEAELGVVVDEDGKVYKDRGRPGHYLDGEALTEDERDVLRPDVENLLGSRAADRFFGPTRTVYFDGAGDGDTYFRNWLSEAEVAFADGDRWEWVTPDTDMPNGTSAAGSIDSVSGFVMHYYDPFSDVVVVGDPDATDGDDGNDAGEPGEGDEDAAFVVPSPEVLAQSDFRLWDSYDDLENGWFGTLGKGHRSDFAGATEADLEAVVLALDPFFARDNESASVNLGLGIIKEMVTLLEVVSSADGKRVSIYDVDVNEAGRPGSGGGGLNLIKPGARRVWLPLNADPAAFAGEGFLLPGTLDSYTSLDDEALVARLTDLGLTGEVKPLSWFVEQIDARRG